MTSRRAHVRMALLKRELHRASRSPVLNDEDQWHLVFDTDSKRLYVEHRWAHVDVRGPDVAESLFECDYLAASWTGIGLSRASTPDRLAANAMRAAETSRRPARSRSSPPQCTSQPKLRSTTQRPASTTKPV